jgi:carboxyl-terminal processing protease
VVLVNGSTASTSEVLAGALSAAGDNHTAPRAQLLGAHTFGKGRTQRVVPLPGGSTLLVSNALVTTPSHARLDKVCIRPAALPPPLRAGLAVLPHARIPGVPGMAPLHLLNLYSGSWKQLQDNS